MMSSHPRLYLAVVLTGLLVTTACGGGDGDAKDTSGTPAGAATAPASGGPAPATAGAQAAGKVPASCTDARITGPLATLIKGEKPTTQNAERQQLLCTWGKKAPLVNVTIGTPATTAVDESFPVVGAPALRKFGAVARAKTTAIKLGGKQQNISTCLITSNRFRITVNYTGPDGRLGQVSEAGVGIAVRLHS